jgi:Vitamin K-dependent gamma-carboxylase
MKALPLDRLSAARRAIERFALAPARAEPLAALRIGLALVLLAQAALIAPSYHALYGHDGILSAPLKDALALPGLPNLRGLFRSLAPLGIRETAILDAAGGLYVISLAALLLGFRTRVAAVLSWLLHLTLVATVEGTNYGADQLAHIFLFYLIWFPSGAALSLDRLLGRAPPEPSPGARLALRVAQIHLCIIYLTSGTAKAGSHAWRNGDAIWRIFMSPEYRRFDFSWLASHPAAAIVAGWAVLVVEMGYAVLIWPRSTRRPWVLLTVGLHLGIAVFMGLTVFGAVMIVFTAAAFGVTAEPRE